ncbi:MAG: CHRD domain-containing protein [Nitrosopumilus sp.]|nr:CHRD domain-containing protein [Nitrosopumilus sp.]
MRTIFNSLLAVITLVIIASTGIVSSYSSNSAFIYAQNCKFLANLSDQEEVIPIDSNVTDIAEFTSTGDSIQYKVNIDDIEGVTPGHIHVARKDENGEVVVTLFKFDTPQNQVSESGTITLDTLKGPLKDVNYPT